MLALKQSSTLTRVPENSVRRIDTHSEMIKYSNKMGKKKDNKDKKTYNNVALEGAATEVVQRYGSAVKEHSVAYTGVDNEKAKKLTRGLKKTAQSKVNSEYEKQNIKQQAGYSAEDKYVARQNARNIINGKSKRYTRTDDLGYVNHPLYDHVVIDENGLPLDGNGMPLITSGEQMKFVGNDSKGCLTKLRSKKFQKYIDADATITVPSDYYEGVMEEADKAISKSERQLAHAREIGDSKLAEKHEKDIAKLKKIKKNLKNSGISTEEAKEARLNPLLSTAKDMTKLAHEAGVQQAKTGAAISGGISMVTNLVSVLKGDKDPADAAIDVVKDTGKGAIVSYATAFTGSIVKGSMQNAKTSTLRAMSKTNLPGAIVTSSIEMGKTFTSYFKGEIDGVQCLEELGEKGTGQLSAAMFAVVGQMAIPIPVVGAMIGSMAGYALSSSCYKQLTQALHDAKLAREERLRIEKECDEAIKMINSFHEEMNLYIEQYLNDCKLTFHTALTELSKANETQDIDRFIQGANAITTSLGGNTPFSNFEEFDVLMGDKNYTFKQ